MKGSRSWGRVVMLGAAVAVAACTDRGEQAAPLEPSAAVLPSHRLADVVAVQNRHTPGLMQREGIIGTGIRQAGSEHSLVVYAVTPSHAAAARLPRRLEGYDVHVVVTGRIDAGRTTTKQRPAPSGFSVGHPDITAGTIGAKVRRGDGSVYILSNNHVIANSNAASVGDPILQPGPYDGGTAADRIGVLSDFQQIVMGGASNTMDAAIAQVNGADLTGSTPSYGAPSTTLRTTNLTNLPVQKHGRTTGHTTGTVTETNVTVSVCYVPRGPLMCAQAATFTGQLGISPGTFSAGGDSGSLIVTNDANRNPVGLLFAGSSTRTLANPIAPVMQRFGITIDPTAGGGGPSDPPDDPPGEDTTAPVAAFAYACSNTSTCRFTDQSTDNVAVTGWAWSGAFASTLQNPQHTFGSAGSHAVTLAVRDAAGNTSQPVTRTISCVQRGPNLRCS